MSNKRFGIKEVADVTFYELNDYGVPGKPVIYLDTLKTSNIEQTAEQTDAKGGKGNAPLVTWDYSKEITIILQDALLSTKTLEMMYGTDKQGVVTISASTFPGTYYVEGTTFARDMKTGKDGIFKFIIPKAKIVSENTITMEADGDPTVFDMKLKVLRDSSGVMIRLVGETDGLQYTPLADGGYEVSGPEDWTGFIDIIIPSSYNGTPVRAIADSGFEDMRDLETVIIPFGVQQIGDRAFAGCGRMGSIVLPDTLESIGQEAFVSSLISSIYIPSNVDDLDPTAFGLCELLEEILVDDGNESYHSYDGVLYEGNDLLKCPEGKSGHLKTLNCQRIDQEACRYCEKITSAEVSAQEIGQKAFADCLSLASVQLNDNVRLILARAFLNCESLTSIVIPAKVGNIDSSAFRGCKALKKIYVCRPQDSIAGAPWDAPGDPEIIWNYNMEGESE